ncbi:prenylated rab acceptor PRA1 [Russula earlei]|uniref:Prenylated rab acceptor PRA1 n=1 Tax=Russula earlei TaxID=71964 RepID=A0ACC0UHE0_9AGAM|nr:prenylated rab acceptor PRA1 [Russula earlei]
METAARAIDTIKSFRETRLSALRPPSEFFDPNRVSRPADLNQAVSRISYNTRYFSGNYGLIIAVLANYEPAVAPIPRLLIGGFSAINKWAPEPMQVGDHIVTQKSLYTGLFVIGLPLLWWASPLGTFFWLVGASGVLIFAHASMIEPGVESEYAAVQDEV